MKASQLRRQLAEKFSLVEPQSAQLDADYLLCHLLSCNQQQLLYQERFISSDEKTQIEQAVSQYLKQVPLDYILQSSEFMGLTFKVNPTVLIPRADTECLVDYVVDYLVDKLNQPLNDWGDSVRILELGTGSGCVAISLLHICKSLIAEIIATDLSSTVLEIAQQNKCKLMEERDYGKLILLESDWYEQLDSGEFFQLIVSNPPYIDFARDEFDPEQLKYEPQRALYSDDKGLADLRVIIEGAPSYLDERGLLVLEHAPKQAVAVRKMMQKNGFTRVETHCDLATRERFSVGTKVSS